MYAQHMNSALGSLHTDATWIADRLKLPRAVDGGVSSRSIGMAEEARYHYQHGDQPVNARQIDDSIVSLRDLHRYLPAYGTAGFRT
jgi:hypothetical protein